MKKVAVTGGMGFIGRYVVEELQRRGYEPIIVDHERRDDDHYDPKVDVFLADVRDHVAMTEVAAHCDGMIHLAAVLGTQETIQNPRPAAMSNLQGGLNFLEAVAQYNLPGVYICVGNHWMNNTYSITKTMIERFVDMFNKDRHTRVNKVRVVNAYGPRQLAAAPFGPGKVRKITPAFVCRALTNVPIEVYGAGKQTSDMVYVEDVAKALVTALEKANQGIVFDKVVEVGPKDHLTVKEIAEKVIELSGSRSRLSPMPMRPGEVEGDKVTADYTTLELVDMNVDDLVSLDEGLSRTIDYFRETKGTEWHDPGS